VLKRALFRALTLGRANAGRDCLDCRHLGWESRPFSGGLFWQRRASGPRKEKGPRGERVAPSGPIQAGRKQLAGNVNLDSTQSDSRQLPTEARGMCHGGSKFFVHQPPCFDALVSVPSVDRSSAAASLIRLKARAVPEKNGVSCDFGDSRGKCFAARSYAWKRSKARRFGTCEGGCKSFLNAVRSVREARQEREVRSITVARPNHRWRRKLRGRLRARRKGLIVPGLSDWADFSSAEAALQKLQACG